MQQNNYLNLTAKYLYDIHMAASSQFFQSIQSSPSYILPQGNEQNLPDSTQSTSACAATQANEHGMFLYCSPQGYAQSSSVYAAHQASVQSSYSYAASQANERGSNLKNSAQGYAQSSSVNAAHQANAHSSTAYAVPHANEYDSFPSSSPQSYPHISSVYAEHQANDQSVNHFRSPHGYAQSSSDYCAPQESAQCSLIPNLDHYCNPISSNININTNSYRQIDHNNIIRVSEKAKQTRIIITGKNLKFLLNIVKILL